MSVILTKVMIYDEVKEDGILPVDISKVLTGSGSFFGPDGGKRAFDKDTSTRRMG